VSANATDYGRIFDRSGALAGPSWRALVGEGLAVLREARRRPRWVETGPVPPGDGHPVIVLPAFLCSDAMSRGLRSWLAALGYEAHGWGAGFNLGPTARAVAAADRVLRRATAAGARATLVGISLGGVLARALANAQPDRVRRVITVCSPFRLPTATPLEPLYRALAPLHAGQGSMLEQLTRPPPVPTVAIYSPNDGVVAWRSCVDEPGAGRDNVAIDAPHTTMLASAAALRAIAERLALP